MLPRGVTWILLCLSKSLLNPADQSFCGLDIFAVSFKPRHPDVDEFVAEQLIGGETQQYLKFLNGQLHGMLFGVRFMPDFFASLDLRVGAK
jgi:hypothetical protein